MAAPVQLGEGGSFRLDLLRLLLVAQVVLGHYAMLGYPPFGQLDLSQPDQLFAGLYRMAAQFGPQAAVVFVAMSGFFLVPRLVAIAQAAGGDGQLARFLVRFLGRRLQRIYPTLVAAIALTALCDLLSTRLPGGRAVMRNTVGFDLAGDASWPTALANLLSLQPTFSPSFGSNGPLWTLGYIVQYYVVGAMLAALWRKSHWLALLCLAALSAAALVWRPEWLLLFGAWVVCGLVAHWRVRTGRGIAAVLAAGTVLFVAAGPMPPLPATIVAALASPLLLISLASPWPHDPRRRLRMPPLLREVPFPLYAFHFPLAVLALVLLLPWRAASPASFTFAWPVLALGLMLPVAFGWQWVLARISRKGTAA
ncbi:MAG: acyltransferase family protein [Croceibacterium sp.]